MCDAAWAIPDVPAPASSCGSKGVGLDSQCLANGITIHFVDWGGRGGDLVLLAGLDDTARVYDELAPLLATHHHVIAVTRRGFGHSSVPTGGYDAATLTADLREFLKAVGVRRADLVGHSMSGLELTRIATSDPDLVNRLVYLDAATDKSPIMGLFDKDPLGDRDPPPSALASFRTLIDWTQQLLKSHSPAIEANLRQSFDQRPTGLKFRTPRHVDAAVAEGMFSDHPDYSRIRAPALAIYDDAMTADQVPPDASAALRAAGTAFSQAVYEPWKEMEKERFRLQIACGRMLELKRTGHYLFLERPRETADWINSFLASENPCAWTPPSQAGSEK
jgi:pimeloyl-ACP methyl ester carboxylesterase